MFQYSYKWSNFFWEEYIQHFMSNCNYQFVQALEHYIKLLQLVFQYAWSVFCVNLLQLLEVVQINTTVYNCQNQEAISEKSASCNCSGEVRKLWEQLSNKKIITESVQQVQTTQKPFTVLPSKNFFFLVFTYS